MFYAIVYLVLFAVLGMLTRMTYSVAFALRREKAASLGEADARQEHCGLQVTANGVKKCRTTRTMVLAGWLVRNWQTRAGRPCLDFRMVVMRPLPRR